MEMGSVHAHEERLDWNVMKREHERPSPTILYAARPRRSLTLKLPKPACISTRMLLRGKRLLQQCIHVGRKNIHPCPLSTSSVVQHERWVGVEDLQWVAPSSARISRLHSAAKWQLP